MGVWEKMPEKFLAALDAEFAISSPRKHGYDTVDAIGAMQHGDVEFFLGMGGNFVRATPDTDATEKALEATKLTVQVSTKLNRSHVVTGKTGIILPTLGRTDRDVHGGVEQFVTVEDSMSVVHRSRGKLHALSGEMRSEVSIVCEIAHATLGEKHPVRWLDLATDYDKIRDHIARVVPGFADFNERVRAKDGFVLPHPPRDSRSFATPQGKAQFTVNEFTYPSVPDDHVIMQTIRSHDQYNTTIYGLSDRYRGIENARRVVLVHPDDITDFGLLDGQYVDLVNEFDGVERRADNFRVVSYPTAKGSVATYFPEANSLIPLNSVADISNTPTSKSVAVRLVSR
jgi:molybdopterin-dependent oxidoreductase alpha subunit